MVIEAEDPYPIWYWLLDTLIRSFCQNDVGKAIYVLYLKVIILHCYNYVLL